MTFSLKETLKQNGEFGEETFPIQNGEFGEETFPSKEQEIKMADLKLGLKTKIKLGLNPRWRLRVKTKIKLGLVRLGSIG